MTGSASPVKKKRRLLLPREEIAWFPELDSTLCNGCGDCEDLCKPGVFALGEPEGVKRAKMTVANPYSCIVQAPDVNQSAQQAQSAYLSRKILSIL